MNLQSNNNINWTAIDSISELRHDHHKHRLNSITHADMLQKVCTFEFYHVS